MRKASSCNVSCRISQVEKSPEGEKTMLGPGIKVGNGGQGGMSATLLEERNFSDP